MNKNIYRIPITVLLASLFALALTAVSFGAEVDENGVPKEGVTYTLTYPDGTVVKTQDYEEAKRLEATWQKIYESKTDKEGKITLEDWKKNGQVKIVEKEVPAGYTADSTETIVDLSEGSVDIVNKKVEEVKDEFVEPTTGPETAQVLGAEENPERESVESVAGNSSKTGDDSPVTLWIILAALAACIGGGIFTRRKLMSR